MGKKEKTVFVCQECGYESPRWMGQCICGAWNSFVEEKCLPQEEDRRSRSGGMGRTTAKPVRISEVRSGSFTRMNTGIEELNRVLGGGLVRGSLTLISGEPGIGKSTLIIQAAAKLAEQYGAVLYVSGEESEEQIRMRADRVCGGGQEHLYLLSETNLDAVAEAAETLKPVFVVIDSIQTMYAPELDSAPGSVSQVRACGNALMRIGKGGDVPIFIVAHVTKSGDLAGPKIVEHLVDCVLNFSGERDHELRVLRAYKNRFGTTSEIGAFEMRGEGLIAIENLSGIFLEGMEAGVEGAVASAVYEGTRPLLLEIQALASTANIGFARRNSVGIDHQRLAMILAVLEKRAGLSTLDKDIYVNVVGGIRPEGTSTDLAVALAVYSSCRSISCTGRLLAIGEIGLTGELRSVQNADKILKEAARMGFDRVLLPAKNAEKAGSVGGVEVIGVRNVREALAAMQKAGSAASR